jgi:argininosuccinate lyase
MALWGGRFSQDPAEMVTNFSESISFDKRLYAHDIRGSIAHVRMLAKAKIIPENDAETIVEELQRLKRQIESGTFNFAVEYEDIHMNIEKCLIEKLGETGARIHTARSRNDQIATDIRLYLRDEIDTIIGLIQDFQKALVILADANDSIIMPGFTHLQNAQPVLFAHHLLAYIEMLHRDSTRLSDCRVRLNQSPLGAGALAGTSLPIDREFSASELGFDGVLRNSMDAVSDRDFAVEFLSACSILMMHMSRLSEDIILWVSPGFSFIELDERFCTGSSLMPQKKNPDIAELTRGKTGRVYGDLIALLTILKGQPLCYNRDLQEDKEPLFDAIDTVKKVLSVFAPMVREISINAGSMKEAVSNSALMATDLVEWLVRRNVPFRTAHRQVGKLIAFCQTQKLGLNEVTLEQMQRVVPGASHECLELLTAEKSVNARDMTGGTSPAQIKKQLHFWKSRLDGLAT